MNWLRISIKNLVCPFVVLNWIVLFADLQCQNTCFADRYP
uniref:Uncharacterized protein n=1 Tax=Arundo donax TaxID=35708 RepID=A0A0A9DG93_ARUDO